MTKNKHHCRFKNIFLFVNEITYISLYHLHDLPTFLIVLQTRTFIDININKLILENSFQRDKTTKTAVNLQKQDNK